VLFRSKRKAKSIIKQKTLPSSVDLMMLIG